MKRTEVITGQPGVKVLSEAEQKTIKGGVGMLIYPMGDICHRYYKEKCGGECLDIDGYFSTCKWDNKRNVCGCPISPDAGTIH